MNIIIPMAGAGSRFSKKGYTTHKPILSLTSRHVACKVPMVVEAVKDLPIDLQSKSTNLIFIMRDFHLADGVDRILLNYFPNARFLTIEKLTEGQASTCLLAREYFETDEPLMIAACDNGMKVSHDEFSTLSSEVDAIIFSFRGNEAVVNQPEAYGWIKTVGSNVVSDVSIKKSISEAPKNDHAIVGTFWFRHGKDFFSAADDMIAAQDLINGEYYVDQVFRYLLRAGQDIRVMEVERYLCWGTPEDYESYEATLEYWAEFVANEEWLF